MSVFRKAKTAKGMITMKKMRCIQAHAVVLLFLVGGCLATSATDTPMPSAGSALELQAPINTWDEAVPLGNGLTGGLLWGEGHTINLSLDRGDLWDLRQHPTVLREDWNHQTMRRLVAERDGKKISEYFDAPYNGLTPTKIPGGRLVVELDRSWEAHTFSLDLKRAEAAVDMGAGRMTCFFSAVQPVSMVRVSGKRCDCDVRFVRPGSLDKLGYAQARTGVADGFKWMVQQAAEGLTYAVVVGVQQVSGGVEIAVAITSTNDGQDPLAIGRGRVEKAMKAGYEQMLEPHLVWWRDFWSASHVSVPDPGIQRHYDLVKYFYGAGSRSNAPPMPLQGVWTADTGNLPPWKGDYHHDLNTQMTYLAYHAAGLIESGLSFIEYNWQMLPTYRRFARNFYGVKGAVVPGVADLAGRPLSGWGMYSLSPTNGAWVAQSFHLHWRYTMDRRFLEQRAYPFCRDIAAALLDLCEPDDQGMLHLPLSSSPEIFDNSLRAWLKPNSNYDLALMRWLFGACAEMARELGQEQEALSFEKALGGLDHYAVDPDHVLMFSEDEPITASHRHHSAEMMIHPLGELSIEGDDSDRRVIAATLDRVHELGTRAWVGYSFSWFACLLARAGRAEQALDYLLDYERAFILRNGFHVNGDQTGEGLSGFTYRPFTLEGNFLAMEAVHEMLLQSWGGMVRLFPAVSSRWPDVSFTDLRAQGGFKVSAERRGGICVFVRIEAAVDQVLRLRNPFADANVKWNRGDLRRDGKEYIIRLNSGDVLIGQRGEGG